MTKTEEVKTIIVDVIDDLNCLNYSVNPIGPATELMLTASSKDCIDTLKEVREKLDKIEQLINKRTTWEN